MASRPDSSERRRPRSRRGLSGDSPLLGGRLDVGAGFEEPRPRPAEYDARSGVLDLPPQKPDEGEHPDPRRLQELIPSDEPGRALDDWGRSQRVFDLMEPLLDFYYRYWFRVDQQGVENVPAVGAEEAMPIFAHVPLLQRLTGLIYFPINHAFPQFGLAAALMYLPAKFEIRFLQPVDVSAYGPDDAEDVALVQGIGEEVRSRIQAELDELLASRRSAWFG